MPSTSPSLDFRLSRLGEERMALINSLKNRNVWIAGGARSGIGAAKFLRTLGARVFVSDKAPLKDETKAILQREAIPFEDGAHDFEKFKHECELLVLSPAIPLDKGLALLAKCNGIPVVSEIEVASWCLDENAQVCAITGTNGKSTTTAYFEQLGALALKRTKACGNFGSSFCEAVADPLATELFSLELSSYQLETTHTLKPQVSIFLNLQEDHLLRYGNLCEYLKAKWRLILMTPCDGLVIVDADVLNQALRYGLQMPKANLVVLNIGQQNNSHTVSKKTAFVDLPEVGPISCYGELQNLSYSELLWPRVPGYANLKCTPSGSILKFKTEGEGPEHIWRIQETCLRGVHNIWNVFAASLAGMWLGIPEALILAQWERKTSRYIPLAHRLEALTKEPQIYVDLSGQKKSITIINDSKATNVESTKVALNSFSQGVRLLLGGEPKGESFAALRSFQNSPIVKIYPFGRAATLIENDLKGTENLLAPSSATLLQAACLALCDAQDSEVILLSPGCASFDEFRHFEHRGDTFKEWARSASFSLP